MNIFSYFNKVNEKICCSIQDKSTLGYSVKINRKGSPAYDLNKFDLALIGISELENGLKEGCSSTPDRIRQKLYNLYCIAKKINIIDLGNMQPGKTTKDTHIAIRDIVCELYRYNTIPVIIGGTQDLTYACYLAYEKLGQTINIVSVDSRLNIAGSHNETDPLPYISRITGNSKNFLFNYSNIGFQTYLVSREKIDKMNQLMFDSYRLGSLRPNLEEIEPVIRDSDIMSFDIHAIRQSEAPAQKNPSPNGLYCEEACSIARYAGLSDRLSCFRIFGIEPELDINDQTSRLAAQIIWFFIEGYYFRKNDFPLTDIEQYTKFIVNLNNIDHDLTFYKSNVSGRWWLEIVSNKFEGKCNLFIACSYKDYQKACDHEIPDRWWKTYQKIN